MKMKKLNLTITFLLLSLSISIAQNPTKYFSEIREVEIPKGKERRIVPQEYKTVKFNLVSLRNYLNNAPSLNDVTAKNSNFIIEIPMPDGTSNSFSIVKNNLLPKDLKAQFPLISTFDGQGIEDKSAILKMDVTNKGFHAMIMSPITGDIFIDPYAEDDTENYIVYFRKDFVTNKTTSCGFEHDEDEIDAIQQNITLNKSMAGDCQLRTYRLALACTGEYATYHGGTKASAQSAMTTTMNRVNGMFERDVAVTMVFVSNNADVIFLNAATDPYANTSNDLNANQTTCDNVIGNANYDIGHLFGTGGGGIAQLNSPCVTGGKARGLTGSSSPVGDPFDIDYVAHEIGHQYGAPHTFNSTSNGCNGNRTASNAWEPGSGLSIMAYAGLCSPHNVQNLSSAFFYNGSMQMMKNNVMNGNSRTCPVVTNNGNQNPVASAGADYIIPYSTPFELIGSATDPNGNTLSYAWEQHDLESTSTEPPTADDNDGPMFRSFLPVATPNRYFPRIQSIIANTSTTGFNNIQWEFLASVARTYNLRMTVRDNVASQGCTHEDNTVITVNGSSGPFIVTAPNTAVTWAGGSTQTVTWNVANTTASPINCANVNIYLSTNGGNTYPITVATNVPNTGSASVTVPNNATTQARIRVQGANNVFFDISNTNFTITAATVPDFTLSTTPTTRTVCRSTSTTYATTATSVAGFNSSVNFSVSGLPANTTASFSPTSVTPTGTTTLTVNTTATTPAGTYSLIITGTSGSITKTNTLTLVVNAVPPLVGLTSPANGATGVSITPNFTWSASTGATSYTIQIATDASFTNIVQTGTPATNSYTASALNITTTYYWRVRAENSCGNSAYTAGFSFTTANIICNTYASTNVPVTIPNSSTAGVTSTLSISDAVTITDINVSNLIGTHNRVNDLIISLTSPAGTTVILLNRPCTNTATNFNIKFDDAAASATIPCPPTNGNYYQPNQALSAFNGEGAVGTWTLRIQDMANPNGGSLTGWSLDICGTPSCTLPAQPGTITGTGTVCSGSTQTYSITAVTGATGYTWTVPTGATINSGQGTTSISVTWGTAGGNLSVIASNSCGNSPARTRAITVNNPPAQPGTITGTASVCSGSTQTYSITAVTGATGYTWAVPTGATINSGQGTTSISVTFGTNGGNVSVIASNTCGNSTARDLAITISTAPAQPGAITGNNNVCTEATITYSITAVTGATGYTWTVPTGATINSGQGTTSISVTFGTTGGNVGVVATNACGNSPIRNRAITVNNPPAQPTAISGTTTVCANSTNTYSITAVTGATSYTWTVPTGATINSGQGTTSVSVTLGTTGGNISVTADNTCGSSTAQTSTITVNSAPAQPGTISGNNNICSGSTITYSIAAVTGATSYTWTVPTGATINSGQGTTSISITFGTTGGNVGVVAINACGNSPIRNRAITVNTELTPSVSINATSSTICSGTNVTFTANPTNGGTTPSYQWQVNGANVGTNSATFNTAALTNGQTVTCILTSSDACATTSTATSNGITISVNQPSSSSITTSACGSYTLNSQTYTNSGTFTQNLTNAAGCDSTITLNLTIDANVNASTSLNGETISSNQTSATYQWIDCNNGNAAIGGETNQSFTATANGNYAVIVTNGTCSETSACVAITTLSISSISNQTSNISVYPNPSNGIITIEGNVNGKNSVNIKIIDMLGRNVYYEHIIIGANNLINTSINLSELPASAYWLEIQETNGIVLKTEKLIIGR
jgi:subtilisin-like proprotein convertase family protein